MQDVKDFWGLIFSFITCSNENKKWFLAFSKILDFLDSFGEKITPQQTVMDSNHKVRFQGQQGHLLQQHYITNRILHNKREVLDAIRDDYTLPILKNCAS